jgi:hypothetical protein
MCRPTSPTSSRCGPRTASGCWPVPRRVPRRCVARMPATSLGRVRRVLLPAGPMTLQLLLGESLALRASASVPSLLDCPRRRTRGPAPRRRVKPCPARCAAGARPPVAPEQRPTMTLPALALPAGARRDVRVRTRACATRSSVARVRRSRSKARPSRATRLQAG